MIYRRSIIPSVSCNCLTTSNLPYGYVRSIQVGDQPGCGTGLDAESLISGDDMSLCDLDEVQVKASQFVRSVERFDGHCCPRVV